jgi:hypothetical protein
MSGRFFHQNIPKLHLETVNGPILDARSYPTQGDESHTQLFTSDPYDQVLNVFAFSKGTGWESPNAGELIVCFGPPNRQDLVPPLD